MFTTKNHALRKKHTSHKYLCRMCPHKSDSARDLTRHHQKMHGILYCRVCNKAFNNQISLRRHEYTHKEKKFQCSKCPENFNFNSELKTHLIQHQRRAKHLCAFRIVENCLKTSRILHATPRNIRQKLFSVLIVNTVPKTNVTLSHTDSNTAE